MLSDNVGNNLGVLLPLFWYETGWAKRSHQACRAKRFTGISFFQLGFLLGFFVNFSWNFLPSVNQLGIKHQVKGLKILCIREEKTLELKNQMHLIALWRAVVAVAWGSSFDFTSYPIQDKLVRLGVRTTDVEWEILPDQAVKMQYEIGFIVDRRMVYD